MHAQVAVEVVVGEVLRGVRHVVGRADVGLAIREGDPDCLRRPRRLAAERLEHDGRILRRGGLGVHMRVLGHDAQLPGIAGGEIIHRAVFAVGVIAPPVVEVFIDDVAGGLRARGGRAVGRTGAGAALAGIIRIDGGERLLARDAVRRQPLGFLIGHHRVGGQRAEVAGLVAGVEAQRSQHVLQLEHLAAGGTLLEHDARVQQGGAVRTVIGAARTAAAAGAGRIARAAVSRKLAGDGGERLRARNAVGGKAVGLLEVVDGFFRQAAEIAGHRAVVIAQRLEVLLKGAHSVRTNAVLEQA